MQGGRADRLLQMGGHPGTQARQAPLLTHPLTQPHPHPPTWDTTMSRVTEVAPAFANNAARSAREACRQAGRQRGQAAALS